MLAGVFIRQYKTYKNQTYIPLIDNSNITGIIGLNGIGKSSILEAFDCFFNDKQWNLNISTKKSGLDQSVYIVPVFIIDRNDENINHESNLELKTNLELIHNEVFEFKSKKSNSAHRPLQDAFIKHLESLERNFDFSQYYLIPIGITHNKEIHTSLFQINESTIEENTMEKLRVVYEFLKNKYEYIYIPKDITPEQFSQIETSEVQKLMGLTIENELSTIIPKSTLTEINNKLNELITDVSRKLTNYEYRTPTDRQQNLRKGDLHKLITKAFFSTRILHKKFDEHWLPIGQLSTGEKAKALVELALKLLTHEKSLNANSVIIAIDEPEASLHISACFDQFEKLETIAKSCRQVLFSTHWYGFLATVNNGSATVITKKTMQENEEAHQFDLIDLRYHREQLKQMATESQGLLPFDIKLKGVNDLIQVIASNISLDTDGFDWIICEGTSELIYLKLYLIDHFKMKKIKIIPVGGASEVKKIYNHLEATFKDMKGILKKKVILLSDTDEELVNYKVENSENLLCKRFVIDRKTKITHLVNPESNPISPATCIEHTLNINSFITTLNKEYPNEELNEILFQNKTDDSEICNSVDLRDSEWLKFNNFFSKKGMKYEFALNYAKHCDPDIDGVPSIFDQLHKILKPTPKRRSTQRNI